MSDKAERIDLFTVEQQVDFDQIGGSVLVHGVIQRCVAFGASFPGAEDVAHQADEFIDLEELYKNIKIFVSAIVKLAGKA